MKHHTIAPRSMAKHHPPSRAQVLVAGTATAIVGILATAPSDAALGADIAAQPVMSATAAPTGAASADRSSGARARNGRIAFEAYPKHAGHASEVMTIRPNGEGRKRLTHNKTFDSTPGWSPYGRRLVFLSGRAGDDELFTMRYSGGRVRQLTHDADIPIYPDWSPHGRRIVFAARVGNDFELFTIRRDGTHLKRLTHNAFDDNHADWSPSGSRIAYTAFVRPDWEIFTIRPDGTDRQGVTHNKLDDSICSYSPSGKRIAVEADNGIYVRRVSGGGLIQVTHSGNTFGSSWSPNGMRIAYSQDTGPDNEIFTIKVDGTKRRQVTHDPYDNFHPDWGVRRMQ
jgi:Tol biopolymer transport system component